ncbi:MAG: SufD family Fe-S cluster assembly protein [Nitrospirae bacterium]|nr:SufD family Fe-S cluster assembly protein [Nitrospirota bacterium]
MDLTTFAQPVEHQRQRVEALRSLEQQVREAALLAGIDSEEVGRAASYFQVDYSAIYERIQRRYQGQLELMTTAEALKTYDWLRDYWWQAVAVDQDKYTAAVELAQTGGFFLRVFVGQRVKEAIQACLLVQENNISQNVHNVIIIEEGADAQLITGCTLHPRVETGLHIGVTEVFLKKGATLSETMIHNWAEGFHVRPRTGVIVEEGATFVSNYILLRPVRSVQAYPRVFLRGARARAQFNSIMVGLKESLIDMGTYVELTGQGTRADAISRAVARDRSTMYLRGELVGQHNESRGHLDCRGMLLSEHARMHAIPELLADLAPRSQLSHEAAVGPIAEETVEYLMTRGLPRDVAISTLVRGFMQIDLPGLPEILTKHIQRVLAATAEHSL